MNSPAIDHCPNCARPTPPSGNCTYCLLELGKSDKQARRPMQTSDLPTSQMLNSQFPQLEISRLIGRGGMGAIYHARQTSLDRDVALKIISRDLSENPAFAERFAREARTLAKLSHPNIVNVYDFGTTTEGIIYLLMEFVDGLNLREAIDAQSLDPRDTLKIICEICSALQYAHDKGVVHRDIKPENVLISEDGIISVADFGLAKLLDDSPANLTLTNTRQVMGTLHYMAPEQMETPDSVDHRADIYSLGVLFYELLTGRLPLGRFEPPSALVPGLPVGLDRIVMKSLERYPENRYQQAVELKSHLEKLELGDANLSTPDILTPEEALQTIVVPFSTDSSGFVETNGVIQLIDDHLELSFRRKTFGINLKSESCRLALSDISKFECRPGMFKCGIHLVPRAMAAYDNLPPSEKGELTLNIRLADARSAALMATAISHQNQSLTSDPIVAAFTESLSRGSISATPSKKRVTAGILFLICAAINLVAMILLLVALSEDSRDPQIRLALTLIPILFGGVLTTQIVGGILTFSPFSQRMPTATAVVSMLPITAGFPFGLATGIYTLYMLSQEPITKIGKSNVDPSTMPIAPSGSGELYSTMMFLKETKSSKILSSILGGVYCCVILGVLLFILGVFLNKGDYFNSELRFRVVSHESTDEALLLQIQQRLENTNAKINTVPSTEELKSIVISARYGHTQAVIDALCVTGSIQLAWTVAPDLGLDDTTQSETEWIVLADKIGNIGNNSREKNRFLDKNRLRILTSSKFELQSSGVRTITTRFDKIMLGFTKATRDQLEETKPENATGLAIIVDDLVECFAKLDSAPSRSIEFEVSDNSKIDGESMAAALRGPKIEADLEYLP